MPRSVKIYRTISLLLVMSYSWLGYNLYFLNYYSKGFSLCLFKNITGIPCPACGITRAIMELMQLNIYNSIRINPLGIPVSLILLVLPFWLIADLIGKKAVFYRFYSRAEQVINSNRAVQFVLIAIILINWGWSIHKAL